MNYEDYTELERRELAKIFIANFSPYNYIWGCAEWLQESDKRFLLNCPNY